MDGWMDGMSSFSVCLPACPPARLPACLPACLPAGLPGTPLYEPREGDMDGRLGIVVVKVPGTWCGIQKGAGDGGEKHAVYPAKDGPTNPSTVYSS